MGVCDPTGKLPDGTIFIPGKVYDTKAQKQKLIVESFSHVFVTRSPCKEPSDASFLPVVSTKPKEMSNEEWQWLCNKPFGSIIFSRPKDRDNAAPLPALTGEGDLDGDYYFVLFEETLLGYLETTFNQDRMKREIRELEDALRKQDLNNSEGPPRREEKDIRDTWWDDAQEEFLNLQYRAAIGGLIGKLWTLSGELAKNSERRNGVSTK